MRRIGLLLSALLLGAWAHGNSACLGTANCTSTGTGNWNNAATWTSCGGSYPQCFGDTANIGSQHVITIPAGVSIYSAVNTTAGSGSNFTTIVINGSLNLSGNYAQGAISEIIGGPDGTLDLRGFTVSAAGTQKYTFTGTSGHPFTVQSAGPHGTFTQAGNNVVTPTWEYVVVNGLGASTFGRQACGSVKHTLFQNNNILTFEVGASLANTGITFENVDFRDPNANGSTIYQPQLDYGSTPLGTCPRAFASVTWSRSSPTVGNIGAMFVRGPGFTFDNVVLADWQTNILTADNTFNHAYLSIRTGSVFAVSGSVPQIVTNSYHYFEGSIGGAHPYSPSGTAALTVTGSVFENTSLVGLKWYLGGAGNNATWTLHNNIFLGMGSALDFAADAASPTMTPTVLFYNNTYYGDQANTYEGTASATLLRVDHSFGILQGSQVEFYNNLTTKPNVATAQNQAISLQNTDANQITYLGYNADFGETATVYSPPVIYSTGCPSGCDASYAATITVTNDQTAHDLSANPQFADRARNVAAWDTSLGGPGTEAHALQEMLKMNESGGAFNSSYTPANLLAYVQAGFVAGNVAFKATGRSGADIGAMPVP